MVVKMAKKKPPETRPVETRPENGVLESILDDLKATMEVFSESPPSSKKGRKRGAKPRSPQAEMVSVSFDFDLPPCCSRIVKVFDALNTVVKFMERNRIPQTFAALQQSLANLCGEAVSLDDIRTLESICPQIVKVRRTSAVLSDNLIVDTSEEPKVSEESYVIDMSCGSDFGGLLPSQDVPGSNSAENDLDQSAPETHSSNSQRSQAKLGPLYRKRAKHFAQRLTELLDLAQTKLLQEQPREDAHQTAGEPADKVEKSKQFSWRPGVQPRDVTLDMLLESARLVDAADIDSNIDQVGPCPPGPRIANVSYISPRRNSTRIGAGFDEIGDWEVMDGPPRPPKQIRQNGAGPCYSTETLSCDDLVPHLKSCSFYRDQIVYEHRIPARPARYTSLDVLPDHLQRVIRDTIGITSLYQHQASAIQMALAGKSVLIATSTASGKSLCYNSAMLDLFRSDPYSTALYMFPTKALAQDQLRAVLPLLESMQPQPVVGVYDGDTPQSERVRLKLEARLLITNPDMLHMSMLPVHGQFQRFLSNLRLVVLDEAHAYSGVFGCHVSLILRRLRRVCRLCYGRELQFFMSTATISNPAAQFQQLTGQVEVEVVTEDGSPAGEKRFLFWNPPLKRSAAAAQKRKSAKALENYGSRQRGSPLVETAALLAECVQHGIRTIAFCKSRKLCELTLAYAREILRVSAPQFAEALCVYRAGYSPSERRQIEADLFQGRLRAVAATNALELGIDIGSLDLTIHLGYPGSAASMWQQAGRAGRREQTSLGIFIAFEGPLDQYFMARPLELMNRPIEAALIDPDNEMILQQHLRCAAVERPLFLSDSCEADFFGQSAEEMSAALVKTAELSPHPERRVTATVRAKANSRTSMGGTELYYIGKHAAPARLFSIRNIEESRYQVLLLPEKTVIEEIEASKAFFEVYEGAVYMHQGKTHLCVYMNLNTQVAHVKRASLKYFTALRDFVHVHVKGENFTAFGAASNEHIRSRGSLARVGPATVTTQYLGYTKIWRSTHMPFEVVDQPLPDVSFETMATWIKLPDSLRTSLGSSENLRKAIHGATHALINCVPMYIAAGSRDVCSECAAAAHTRGPPARLLLYDNHAGGGIGLAERISRVFLQIVDVALESVRRCDCEGDDGCPSCVVWTNCSESNKSLSRSGALRVLEEVVAMHR